MTTLDEALRAAAETVVEAINRQWLDADPGIPATGQFPVYLTVQAMRDLRAAVGDRETSEPPADFGQQVVTESSLGRRIANGEKPRWWEWR